jgi:hypothetical protein
VFSVSDRGKGIDPKIIEESSNIQKRQEPLTAPGGTGLKRVFRVSEYRNWNVTYRIDPGTTFFVEVPISEGVDT